MDCKTAQQMITPFIEHRLNDREMEAFIEHIRGCKACSEELEVYFTIYYALEQLDHDRQGSYDIKQLLEQELQRAEKTLQKHNIVKFYRKTLMGLIGIVAAVFAVTAVQTLLYGSIEETTLYHLLVNEESEPETQAPAFDDKIMRITEEAEQETNQKRQVIVTTPETEAKEKLVPAGGEA